ncbi:MAG: L,D-transpeptidase family protein [Anaerolineales bacterium]
MKNNRLNREDAKAQRHSITPTNSWLPVFKIPLSWLLALTFSLLALILASCTPAPTPASTPTATASPLPPLTPTASFTPSPTPTIIPTPEPAWFTPLDPGLGKLKFQYAEVVNDRARVYVTFQDAVAKNGNFGHLPEYPAYVAYSTSRTSDDGRTFFQTQYGWMDGADLQALTPSAFTGILLTREVTFRFGWVLADSTSVNAAGTSIKAYTRYQLVHEVPAVTQNPGYIAVGADEWLPEQQVALVDPQVPADAGAGACRFIYVNLARETLTVYNNCKLEFATLVSSGKNSWTFEGQFAILYKVEYSSIQPPATSTSEYYIEGVPYFMTYAGNFGFHGAYWQDSFGTAASHGCINLSPTDAKWLYDWAGIGERVIISAGK